MKIISIIERVSEEAIQKFAKKHNIPDYFTLNYHHPQEDFLIASKNPPVFVVADGVTLDFKKLLENNVFYPSPSPAGDVARIFCESVVEYVKNKFKKFDEEEILNTFKYANKKVKKYNQKTGKTDISGNATEYYSSTGSFAVIKDKKAYWSAICDSFVAHFDKRMNLKFITSGLCRPYAVINGEERMAEHLEKGVFELAEGDRVFVFTDGFEYYMQNREFVKIFKDWDDNLKERISEFSNEANLKDPTKYGHERSLIVVLI